MGPDFIIYNEPGPDWVILQKARDGVSYCEFMRTNFLHRAEKAVCLMNEAARARKRTRV
jgi:hypothetical protein